MNSLCNLPTPSFCVREDIVRHNCERMQRKAREAGVALRPHVKTHKAEEIALLQLSHLERPREGGIVVSTLAEAEFFADKGFQDILYGVPLNIAAIDRVHKLHMRIPRFHVLLDNSTALSALVSYGEAAAAGDSTLPPYSVFVAVDCGYHREGVDPDDPSSVDFVRAVAESRWTTLSGVYTHSGNSYNKGDEEGARRIGSLEADRCASFVRHLREEASLEVPHVSVGSTPSASTLASYPPEITEIHPGNYTFYDRQQVASGACEAEDVAVFVLGRVVGVYPRRNEVLLNVGATALHKDDGGAGVDGWGCALEVPHARLDRISQEVSVLRGSDDEEDVARLLPLGATVRIQPNHSCLAAAGFPTYTVLDSEGRVTGEEWVPCKGW